MFACAWISAARTFAIRLVSSSLIERWNDGLAVFSDDRLRFLHHQIKVELVDADLDQLLDSPLALLHRANHAEPVDDVVRNEIRMIRTSLGVLRIVIVVARLDEIGRASCRERV